MKSTALKLDCFSVNWPVRVNWPEGAKVGEKGVTGGKHLQKVFYVTFEMLTEHEHDKLFSDLDLHSKALAAASDALAAAETDKDRKPLERRLEELDASYRGWRAELLRRVVIGLPEGHGWDAVFSNLPEFSPDLVEAMAGYRVIGKALEAAYWALVNGETQK